MVNLFFFIFKWLTYPPRVVYMEAVPPLHVCRCLCRHSSISVGRYAPYVGGGALPFLDGCTPHPVRGGTEAYAAAFTPLHPSIQVASYLRPSPPRVEGSGTPAVLPGAGTARSNHNPYNTPWFV